jgi:hypothetical protein
MIQLNITLADSLTAEVRESGWGIVHTVRVQ